MTGKVMFLILMMILVFNFIKEKIVSYVNAKHFNDPIPKELQDVYDAKAYQKSQDYKQTNYKFSTFLSTLSFVLTMAFFLAGGVTWLTKIAQNCTDNSSIQTLIFFGILGLASMVFQLPFSYYHTFVIEEKFGFNKSTKSLFFIDKLKGLLLSILIGGGLLFIITWLYQLMQQNFWWIAWLVLSVITICLTMFYANLIVPMFNKQTPLEESSLKEKLVNYSKEQGFELDAIFVIDGSKRSTKANAYFTGLGSKKRIVLYDTLIKDLSEEEIVAVFAHEVGHYKKKHTLFNLLLSLFLTGITFYILGLLLGNPLLAAAFNLNQTNFYVGLLAFGILYSPISEVTGLLGNLLSRKYEYEADNFAKETYEGDFLISSLKKLSKNSLSNLTPHPWQVFLNYSHPTLLQRVLNLKKEPTS